MALPEERIVKFIRRHHVMTLATVGGEGKAYCSNIFYSYITSGNKFVFTTETRTRHGAEMAENAEVAASVVLETRNVGKVQGLQIAGRVRLAEGEELRDARKSYLLRFPYAVVAELTLWVLEPSFMKLTDNRLGFGKKLLWHEEG